jgi:DNA-binding NtrC family response regulator
MAQLNLIVEETLKKHAGISIKELNRSITQTLENRLSSSILIPIKYKDAKKIFQKAYFQEILILNLGNISKAAEKAKLNRRQIHRICIDAGINQKDIREQMIKPYNYLKQNIQEVIEDKMDKLKDSINKDNVDKLYKKMPLIAENITEFIEERIEPYDEAFLAFERHYFTEILRLSDNKAEKAAEISGLSTRSILRKMQTLEIA